MNPADHPDIHDRLTVGPDDLAFDGGALAEVLPSPPAPSPLSSKLYRDLPLNTTSVDRQTTLTRSASQGSAECSVRYDWMCPVQRLISREGFDRRRDAWMGCSIFERANTWVKSLFAVACFVAGALSLIPVASLIRSERSGMREPGRAHPILGKRLTPEPGVSPIVLWIERRTCEGPREAHWARLFLLRSPLPRR